MWSYTFAFIFVTINVCFGNQDICEECKTNVNSLKTVFESSDQDLEQISSSLCFKESKCAASVKAYLMQAKNSYAEKNVETEEVCKPMCGESVGLGVKAHLAIMSVLSNLLNLVKTKHDKWKTNFCNACPEQLQPFSTFFATNEAELEGKIGRTCYAFSKAGIASTGCEVFIKGLLTKAKDFNFPLCPLLCKKYVDQIEDKTNRDKLAEIAATDEEMKSEVNEKLAKVDEVIQDTEETMPYVLTSDGEVNAFCTLCITFTTKLPLFEQAIVDTISEMIAEIMFDDETIQTHNLVDKLRAGINSSFSTFVSKYRDPTICKSKSVMACSSYTFDIVEEKLNQQSAKKIECDSCETFLSYIAPILSKSAAQKHLSEYLFKEVTTIFSASLLDNLSLDVYQLVSGGIEKLAQLFSDKGTCSKTKSCSP